MGNGGYRHRSTFNHFLTVGSNFKSCELFWNLQADFLLFYNHLKSFIPPLSYKNSNV